ncbi:MAG TPA: DNA polymerase III subunit delta', partial [Nocardioides sp.]
RTEKLTLGVDEIRDLVRQAALSPAGSRWQILIIEDADRLTEQANNALLKAVEEPGARTVWMLCAPTVEDVLPTIRSRCRLVTLSTPTAPDVTVFLQRTLGVDEARAAYAARASQSHIGRAKALARDDDTRRRREQVVAYPARLNTLADALRAAGELAAVSKEEADAVTADLDAQEKADLDTGYGVVDRGRRPREYGPALSALEKDQKRRATRRHRDVIDRGLMDLVSVYRDAIAMAAGAPVTLVNEEHRREIEQLVAASTPELNLQRIGAIFEAREQLLEFNVQPQLVLEAMMVALLPPGGDQ